MDSVVWVEVPENHTAMITILHLNLTGHRYGCDTSRVTLALYEVSVTVTKTVWYCRPGKATPPQRRRLATGSDLSVHFACGETPKVGFRLFYSVVPDSLVLRKAGSGEDSWNCSGPNFAEFQPHFPCDLFPQCVDKEDEWDCPYFSEDCGPGFVTLDTHCLAYEQRPAGFSWRDLEFVCQQRGMRMANLRSRKDHARLVQYLEPRAAYWGFKMIAVGIRTSSSSFPLMYRREMQFSDGTVAFHRRTKDVNDANNVCGFLLHKKDIKEYADLITVNYCSKKYTKHYDALCEVSNPSWAGRLGAADIQLRPVSSSNGSRPPLLGCPGGHGTRDFLACDVKSACWSRDLKSCNAPLAPLPPSFACASGFESVAYTLVCDVRPDCRNGSDESFCQFPPCGLPEPFHCSDRECVARHTVCDGQQDCYNARDEDLCSVEKRGFVFRPAPPAIIQLTRRGQFTVNKMDPSQLADLSPAVCPETHFQCPGNGYCTPVFLRCNGVYDCVGKEDEAGCNSYTCPGFYRCRGSQICLHPQHVCDGIFQCPRHDDELVCDLSCPENCTCYGLAFYCRQPFQARNFTELRFLDGRGSGMKVSELTVNVMLIYLSLAANGLITVGNLSFPNLRVLDLSDNRLKEIHLHDVSGLPQLETLTLSGNPVLSLFQRDNNSGRPPGLARSAHSLDVDSSISTVAGFSAAEVSVMLRPTRRYETMNAFLHPDNATEADVSEENDAVASLRTLDVSRVKLRVVDTTFLSLLPNLHTVNMSGGGVDTLLGEGFQALTQLRVLDLRHCPLTNFPRNIFRGLQELETVYSDNYKLCCSATLPVGFVSKNCHAPSDRISSCEALLKTDSYRIFLSVFAFLALVGNASSFVFRVLMQNTKKLLSFDVFVAHLCVADFWMGVYLSIIGVADRLYQGTYLWEDNTWKASTVCHMAGFLSLVSSEVSALVICLITIDRFLVIRFPFSTFHFGTRSAQVASLCVWGLGCLTAAVPLVYENVHWTLYSQSGICIPLPLGRPDIPGYTYTFTVMIVGNFVLFLVIAAGQLFVYWKVYTSNLSYTETTKKIQDLTIARRLVTVAMSDFLCWFPIGLAGILAATGTPVSSEVNVALAIFVLPFNSALNPFLYTLNIVLEKRRKAAEERIKKRLMTQFRSTGAGNKSTPAQVPRVG